MLNTILIETMCGGPGNNNDANTMPTTCGNPARVVLSAAATSLTTKRLLTSPGYTPVPPTRSVPMPPQQNVTLPAPAPSAGPLQLSTSRFNPCTHSTFYLGAVTYASFSLSGSELTLNIGTIQQNQQRLSPQVAYYETSAPLKHIRSGNEQTSYILDDNTNAKLLKGADT